jgi:hypothetical protein
MKKIYFLNLIFLSILSACSSSDSPADAKLNASFTLTSATFNVGDEIKITNTSTADNEIVSYSYQLGNNITVNEKEPTIYYPTEGDYTIKLIIKDINGKVASSSTTIKITSNSSLFVENQNPAGSTTSPLEIGIRDNKIFYTEVISSVLTSNTQFYRHLEYDDVTKTFTSKVIASRIYNTGNAQTTFLNNGNTIVTMVESLNFIGSKEVELDSEWNSLRADNYTNKTVYGSIQNNDQYYFYGSYNQNPAIEIRNSAGQFVSRKTYEGQIKNAFIGDLIKTGNSYIAYGGKYESSTTDDFMNYKPIILFFNENLELTDQKTFGSGYLSVSLKNWNDLNGKFKIRKLSNGNLALYSHDELRITSAQGEEINLLSFNNSNNDMQSFIELENSFIVSRSGKLEKYDNTGKLIKSVSYSGMYNSGFVKKGDLIYFAAASPSSYGNYSVYKTILGAVDSNLAFKKI